jgi:hypothetical protein
MAGNAEHRGHSEDPLILAALAVIVVGLVAVLVWLFWHVGHDDGEAAAHASAVQVVQPLA